MFVRLCSGQPQHPPLFYLLLAPFVGPLAAADHVLAAGFAGRAVNVVITVGLVAAVMWASSALAPSRPQVWLASGTVAALYPLVLQVGGAVYNDNLSAAWAALLVGLTARMMRSGATVRRLVLFGLVAAAALWTRSAGVVVIAVCATTLGAALLVSQPRRWRNAAGVVIAVAGAVGSSAWFYLRNQRLTGNLLGGHFGYLPHRVKRPLPEVATRVEVWDQLLMIHGYGWVDRHLATAVLVGVPVVVAAAIGVRHVLLSRRVVPELTLAVLLSGLTGAVLLTQLMYVSAGGGASERYLAPLTVVVAFAVGCGLTAMRPLGPVLLGLWAALEFGPLAAHVVASLHWVSLYSSAPLLPVPSVVAIVVAGSAIVVSLVVQIAMAAGDVHRSPTAHRSQVVQRPDSLDDTAGCSVVDVVEEDPTAPGIIIGGFGIRGGEEAVEGVRQVAEGPTDRTGQHLLQVVEQPALPLGVVVEIVGEAGHRVGRSA